MQIDRSSTQRGLGEHTSPARAAALMASLVFIFSLAVSSAAVSAIEQDRAGQAHADAVAVIDLKGQVGGATSRGVRDTFDAHLLETLLQKVHAEGARTVIVAVDSPGGLIEESVRISALLQRWNEQVRVVVYPRSVLYDAAPIALAAPELAVWPGSYIGVPEGKRDFEFDRDGNPNRPLPTIHWRSKSHVRTQMEAVGRPPEFSEAMYELKHQMFWCQKHGISWEEPENWKLEESVDPKTGEVIPPPVVDEDERWIQLDGPESLLGVDGVTMHRIGLAQYLAMGVEDLITQLGLSEDTPIITCDELAEQYITDLQEQYISIDRQVRTFERYLGRLVDQLRDLADVINGEDRNAINSARRAIGRTRSELLRAARIIVRTDDRVLERRVRDVADLRMLIETHSPAIERMARGSRDTKASLERDMRTVEDIADAFKALLAAGEPPRY